MRLNLDPLGWGRLIFDFATILLGITGAVVFWYKRRGSLHWPSVYGTVEYGLTSDQDGWRTNLVYSYSVKGEFYSGAHSLKARNESHADELARTWKGRNLIVRYSHQNPALSVIRMQDQEPVIDAAACISS